MKRALSLLTVLLLTALFLPPSVPALAAGKVIIYNWSEYIPDDVLEAFTKETGIEVVYTTYESNESMHDKLLIQKGRGYDLVCPSTYFIPQMIKEGLALKIDKKRIPNLKNVDPKLLNQEFDPDNRYSIPYMWGNYGLIFNSALVKNAVTSWNDLLRPEFKGKIMLYDDPRMTMGIALLATGASLNSTKESEIRAAYEFLLKLRDPKNVFDVTAAKNVMVNNHSVIGGIWNGDAQVAMDENSDLVYIYPKEGVPLWMDSFVIPSGADNVDNAYAFINFMLRPEMALRSVEEYRYSSPNLGTLELMDKKMRESRLLNPTADDLRNAVMLNGVGEAKALYDLYWEKFITDAK
ncbi:MAG: spermidine/putrescine ABC transporter substrate-binding protein [Deltaproteobacteria bacterium]|nr:spermidine/putrescine ABC transporter substrate-binding protein [Deltaproteobacteria bacterium]